MSLKDKKILLVGCGKMGGALLNGWLKQDWCNPENITVVEPYLPKLGNGKIYKNVEELKNSISLSVFDVVVFAIKPQDFSQILPEYSLLSHSSLIISIAAGKKVSEIINLLGRENRFVVRVMPNLPASIGKGFSCLYSKNNLYPWQAQATNLLFKSVGEVFWSNPELGEEQIDKITALSGSGPAYFYYFIEALQKSAENLGFSESEAKEIAMQTAIGAIELLKENGDAKALREAVTSKGGTTEAGLNILMDGRLQNILDETVKAALKRATELNS